MLILDKRIDLNRLTSIAGELYGDMVKAAADVRNRILAIDAELHSDLERLLLENGSNQEDIWGINLYPEMDGDEFIEFDSLINIRPRQNNNSRYVEDVEIRRKIVDIVNCYIDR